MKFIEKENYQGWKSVSPSRLEAWTCLTVRARAKEEGLTLADANQRKYLNRFFSKVKIPRNNYLRLIS